MKFTRVLLSALLFGSLFVMIGCSSTDDDVTSDEVVPAPFAGDPNGGGLDGDVKLDEDITLDEEGFTQDGQTGLPPRGKDNWEEIDRAQLDLPIIYFAYDQFRIGTSERPKLQKVADYFLQNKGIGLIIQGHCDERGSDEYNRALGERRALAVRDYLVNLGVPDSQMKTVSYGEERPAVEGNDESAWAKNRRAELFGAKM